MKKPLVLTIWVLKTWPSLLSFATFQSHSRFAFYAFQELFNSLYCLSLPVIV